MIRTIAWLLPLLILMASGPARAWELVITDAVPASSLNPFNQMDAVSHRVCVQIYDHLVELTDDGRVKPALAVSWTEPEPGIHRFRLRRDVRFHSGRLLTADDVIYSLERARKGKLGSLLKITGLAKLSTYEIEVKSPSPSILADLAFAGFIVPRGSGDSLARHPIGTGAYRFVDRPKPDRIVLERFDDGWRPVGPDRADRVIFQAEAKDRVRKERLQQGLSHIITDVNPHLKLSLMESHRARIRLYSQKSARSFFIAIDSLPWPGREDIRTKLADPRVRRALNLAVDKRRIINIIMLGNGLGLGSCLADAIQGSSHSPAYGYDPRAAADLLKQAGAEGMSLKLAYPQERWFGAEYASRAVAKYLEQIGLKVELVPLTWKKFLPVLASEGRKFDLYYWSWGNPILDPSFTLGPLLRRDPFRPWDDARFNQGYDAAEKLAGPYRLAAYVELDRYLHRAAPWIFLFQKVDSYASVRRILLKTSPTEIFRVAEDVTLVPEVQR